MENNLTVKDIINFKNEANKYLKQIEAIRYKQLVDSEKANIRKTIDDFKYAYHKALIEDRKETKGVKVRTTYRKKFLELLYKYYICDINISSENIDLATNALLSHPTLATTNNIKVVLLKTRDIYGTAIANNLYYELYYALNKIDMTNVLGDSLNILKEKSYIKAKIKNQ